MAEPGEKNLAFAIADRAPNGEVLTDYDRDLAPLYIRLLDAEKAAAPWEDVARRLLAVDPDHDRDRARMRFETHMARARWLSDRGFAQLASRHPS